MNIFSFIKTRVTIWDVVQEYVTLHKAGNYWKARCPFHHEKTASFTVSPHKDIFYCFGCHMGGDIIAFIQKAENCSPIEAAKFLAERFNIDLPNSISLESDSSSDQKNKYHTICTLMAQWCHHMLGKHPSVLQYLINRAFDKSCITYFTLGYFPGGLQKIQDFIQFMSKKGILVQDLIQANIISQGKTVLYSSFEDRLIFPIKDHLGRFCGFGGRILKEQDTRPKYYNSRENNFFNKGSILFGLDLAKKEIQQSGQAFLVEGYTDCIAMTQAGFKNTIATLGTACTIEHLKHVSRLAQELFIIYDGDTAGHKAVLRLTQLCWQVNLDLKVINLPKEQDPASFILKGNNLSPFVQRAQDIFEFFIESTGSDFKHKSLGEKLAITRKFLSTIEGLDDPLKQDILLQKAGKIFDIPFDSLKNELSRKKIHPVKMQKSNEKLNQQEGEDTYAHLEKGLFCAILNNVDLLKSKGLKHIILYLPKSLNSILKKLKEEAYSSESFDFQQFFGTLDSDEQQLTSRLLLEYEDKPTAFDEVKNHLHKKLWKKITVDIQRKIAQAKENGDEDSVYQLVREFIELKKEFLPNSNIPQLINKGINGKKNI